MVLSRPFFATNQEDNECCLVRTATSKRNKQDCQILCSTTSMHWRFQNEIGDFDLIFLEIEKYTQSNSDLTLYSLLATFSILLCLMPDDFTCQSLGYKSSKHVYFWRQNYYVIFPRKCTKLWNKNRFLGTSSLTLWPTFVIQKLE